MKQEEINKGNEEIAVFMGGEFLPAEQYGKVTGRTTYPEWQNCEIREVNGMQYSQSFEFHTSMKWLYPVCQKIIKMIKLFEEESFLRGCIIDIGVCLNTGEDPLEIFTQVSDFCKEYNKLKNI